jgi:hypothetical protein
MMFRDGSSRYAGFQGLWSMALVLALGCDPHTPDGGHAGCQDCAEDCSNGVDDDSDGDADCLDSACAGVCPEVCDNGEDDNADWLVDCGDPSCESTCDADGDGWLSRDVGGDDCNDGDPAVHPGAAEIADDGEDNDCDPSTADDDIDGDLSTNYDDCAPEDPTRYPQAPEVCGDGVVNDCDQTGTPPRPVCFGERSLSTADFAVDGSEAEGHLGDGGIAGADTDGDGAIELYIGASDVGLVDFDTAGAVYALETPLVDGSDVRTLGCELTGVSIDSGLGAAVAPLGVLDGSGLPRIGIGAPLQDLFPDQKNGALFVLGEVCASGPINGSAFEITGRNHDEYGTSFAAIGDADGDGAVDVAIGAPWPDESGSVAIYRGPIDAPQTGEETFSRIVSTRTDTLFGATVAAAGDLDGDGLGDLLVGAPLAQQETGQVQAVTDLTIPGTRADTDQLAIPLGAPGDHLGTAIAQEAGDLSGDGQDDAVLGAPLADDLAVDGGVVYVVDALAPLNVAAILRGDSAGDLLGSALAAMVDLDGDGFRDLAVGAPGHDGGDAANPVVDAGAVYVWFGPLSGSLVTSTAEVRLIGEAGADFAGSAIADVGDVDHDGLDDLAISAPYADGAFPGAGRVYLLTFGW